ncbi:MAG: hypothetical protein A3K65_04905 [Euryarchaeota archaeon RBG_16_68_12]|nr:MAG: hypothetical protein A3K65_04905 [Euryarchaeota archaeon RBG_16_68_12]
MLLPVDPWRADQVLSNRVRLDIVQALLSEKELHISELERSIKKPWGTVAYHLGLLEDAGIVKSEYRLGEHQSKAPVKRYYWVQKAKLREYVEAWGELPRGVLEKVARKG